MQWLNYRIITKREGGAERVKASEAPNGLREYVAVHSTPGNSDAASRVVEFDCAQK